jgi:hypothetical protein
MAGRRSKTSAKKKSTKRTTKRRGGNWFKDLGDKIKNEFVNPQSVLRQQFYQDGPIRGELRKVAEAVKDIPGLGTAAKLAVQADDAARLVGVGKYVVYRKKKTHGKRKSHKRK